MHYSAIWVFQSSTMDKPPYIIETERLGLRPWYTPDLDVFIQMNKNEDVMRFFPNHLTDTETKSTYNRLVRHQNEHGYCFFATDVLSTGNFIGFIGLVNTRIDVHFTPCVEIGWRLTPTAWGKGYATEGAKACLEWAFKNLDEEAIYSYTPHSNIPSQRVMQKIGMSLVGTFSHPLVLGHELEEHVLYKIDKPDGTRSSI